MRYCIIYLIFIWSSHNCIAQPNGNPESIILKEKFSWITLGVGGSIPTGTSSLFDYTIQKKQTLYSTKVHVGSGGDSFASISYNYGKASYRPYGHYSASVGLAVIMGGNGTGGAFRSAGLDLCAQAYLKFGKIGLGVYLLGNLNSFQSNLSIMVAMQFGTLR